MAIEIERKFLVKDDSWRKDVESSYGIRQAYFFQNPINSVRLRIIGDHANLNIKSGTLGIRRLEFEYDIPIADGLEMLELCIQPYIEKIRHIVYADGYKWEIDEFLAENSGLVVAEVELQNENDEIAKPVWLGNEVSHDPAYYNVCLIERPYKSW